MKGLDICQSFYLEYGDEMLKENFAEYYDEITVGLCGEGSECLGYDDEISRDHDFDAGFCIFIDAQLEREIGFRLERAYAKLPKEFMGLKRQTLSPTGGNRRGVIITEDFYTRFLGKPTPPQTAWEWLNLPTHALLNGCNGKIFKEGKNTFSQTRRALLNGYPLDVKKKKLAANLIVMAQSGQYNYARCIDRGESGAAQLAVYEFVKSAIATVYLLNDAYQPYYKWVYKGMRELKLLSDLEFTLIGLTELGNGKKEASEKREIIEDVARIIIDELKRQSLTTATCNNLETHAYSVTDEITDHDVRNMNIFEGL